MDELVRWLTTCLDEDERIAKAATPGPWVSDEPLLADWVKSGILGYVADCSIGTGYRPQSAEDAVHIAAHDPARVLREIDAKRQVVVLHELAEQNDGDGFFTERCMVCDPAEPEPFYPCRTLRLLALPYADRPGYREEWRP